MQHVEDIHPWYKQFWPWFLIGLVLFAIAFCMVLVWYATHGADTLVNDDYYRQGLLINQQLDKDKQARVLGLEAEFHFRPNGQVQVRLDSHKPLSQYPFLNLHFIHPTLAHRDHSVKMRPVGDRLYAVKLDRQPQGHWYLDLRDPNNDWRLKGEIGLPDASVVKLFPAKN